MSSASSINTYVDGDPFLGFIPGTNQFLITLAAAIFISGLFALVLGALSLRTSGVPFIMITLAFAQMLFFLFVSLKAYGGDDGLIVRRRNVLFDLNMADDTTFYYRHDRRGGDLFLQSSRGWCARRSGSCSAASARTSAAWPRSASRPINTSSPPS